MSNKWEYVLRITNLLPTPAGWRAFRTWRASDGEYHHEEIPIVGFASVRRLSRIKGAEKWCQDSEEHDEAHLLLFNHDFSPTALLLSVYEELLSDNEVCTVVCPKETFDEQQAIEDVNKKLSQKKAA